MAEYIFDGPGYDPTIDNKRLSNQIARVYHAMTDQEWRTLAEIERLTGDPQASVSAQLRHLRQERFGAHQVDRRRRTDDSGLYEYRLIPSDRGLIIGARPRSGRKEAAERIRAFLGCLGDHPDFPLNGEVIVIECGSTALTVGDLRAVSR